MDDAPGPGDDRAVTADPPVPRLALLEVLERDGRVRRTLEVTTWPVRIGRALDNDLVLDDPHVAAHHLTLAPLPDGVLAWQAGHTVNGVLVGTQRVAAGASQAVGAPAAPRATVLVGLTRLRLRLPDDPLPAERPLARGAGAGSTALVTLLLAAVTAAGIAIGLDPGDGLLDWAGLALAPPLALVAWCVGWGLASKLFQHRFEFTPHWAVAVRGALVYSLVAMGLPQVAASGGWPLLANLTELLLPVVAGLTVAAHARLVLPTLGRREALVAGVLMVGLLGLDVARNLDRLDRPFQALYMATLPMPALRWHAGVPPARFVDEAAALRADLDRRVAEDAPTVGGDSAAK